MKTYWLIGIILLVDFTLLLVDDYFPGALGIPVWSLYAVLAVVVLISFMTHDPELEKRFALPSMLLLTIYPMLTMVLLSALGGESQSGFSVTSPFLWLFWGILLWLGWHDFVKQREEDMEQAD